MKTAKSARKRSVVPTVPPAGVTVARTARSPVNGAEIPLGAHPANTGGKAGRSGRPTNEIRELMRGALGERTGIYTEIADGKPIQRTRVPVAALYKHVACTKCGEHQLAPKDADDVFAEIEVETSASPRDRLAALDQLARYGMGAIKEISVDQVRERVQQTLDVIQARVSSEQYVAIVEELDPIWA